MDKSIQFKNAQWCQRNMHGIEIKACCASCEHKVINNDGRFCGLEKTRVASGHCCNRWQMDKRLQIINSPIVKALIKRATLADASKRSGYPVEEIIREMQKLIDEHEGRA